MKDRDGWIKGTVKWMEQTAQTRKDVSLTDLCRTLMADILYGQRIKDEGDFQNVLAAFAQSGYYASKDPNGPWALYLGRKCNRDRDFDRFLQSINHQRRLSMSTHGVPCLVPDDTVVGDLIVIFIGTPLPFVIRRREHHQYRIVGSCYVHGYMDGQAMENADLDVQEFEVV